MLLLPEKYHIMIDILRMRRSIRKYTEQAIEPEKIDLLKEAVLRSPTSKNNKPCEYIFVTDKVLLEKLSIAKPHGASLLKNAPLGVVVCADETKSDVWVEDASIASILLQLAAQTLGLGSCWVQIRKRPHNEDLSAEEYIKNELGLREELRVLSVIGIGYPAKVREGLPFDELEFEKISER